MLSFDYETTTKEANNFGHPFDCRNRPVLLSCYDGEQHIPFHYGQGTVVDPSAQFDDPNNLYVAFNAKFDMHWLRREHGIILPLGSVWCCQVAEMALTRQQFPMPSLNDALDRYGLERKYDVVKEEYWKKGIDTDLIPYEILLAYGNQDSRQTYKLAELQIEEAKERGMYNAIRMSCCDLVVLAEMEWNGMVYDVEKSNQLAVETAERIAIIDHSLRTLVGDDLGIVSFDSPFNISAVLFGGSVKYKKPYVHVFKNGNSKIRHTEEVKEFPRLIEPPKEAKLPSTDDYYSTSTVILGLLNRQKLTKFQRSLLDKLTERSKLEQLRGTYYTGIPKLFKKYNWKDGTIHHSLNQTVAITGRLSSSNPNLQNQSKESKQCFVSRFK